MVHPLAWLFGASTQRDGASRALETVATGVPPASIDAIEAEETPAVTTGRRDRALEGGDRVVMDGLALKVLHGWLQNRHQTLYPLTINLRQLSPEQGRVLAQWAAVTLLAARPDETGDVELRRWFGSVGAGPDTMVALGAALSNPPPLHRAVEAVIANDVSPHAYVVSLVALDAYDPVTTPFLEYAAARLSLPTTVVRSATRRYRR